MYPESDPKGEKIKPSVLYHASENRDIEEFEPRRNHVRDDNEGPVVFATPDKAVASLFIVPTHGEWVECGLHDDVPYMVISDREKFKKMDKGGVIYFLPPETFEVDLTKGMREYEWTSNVPVKPIDEEVFESGLEAMLNLGVQVYFVDMTKFEEIRSSKDHGFTILQTLDSENQRLDINVQSFTGKTR